MKMLKEFRFSGLILVGSLILVLFTSYGNRKAHPDINGFITRKFLDLVKKDAFNVSEFRQYKFNLVEGTALEGRAVTMDGLFSDQDVAAAGWGFGTNLSSEGTVTLNPYQWIVHGGYAADVPEVPASLRHFYDPTRNIGDRYLTDITNAKVLGSLQKYVLTNPRIDGVEWALGKPGDISEGVQDHKYTWEHGKLWMQMALREPKLDKRKEYMAGAWRSLGETLHMIADNGCPPHVRNDAHPSPLWNNNTWLGNPDPYEELMDVIKRDNPADFSAFAKGTPDATLAANFRSAKKVFDIADALAVFTNANMVTNETIFGTDRNGNLRRPITHPETPYGSPMLESMTYTENDYCYRSATGVKQCVDHYIYARLLPMYCYPFVDMECVKSQAGVLIPNIIAAGTDAIRLFIPKLTVDIESVENGVLKGKVTHKTDDEYPIEIKYNGEVILSIQDRSGKETDAIAVDAKEGLFEQDGIKPDKDEKIVAKIEFGGITVESSEFMNMASIFGIYQGTYTLQMNEANMLEMYNDLSMNASMDAEMRQTILGMNQHKVQMDRENIAWIKGGAQGGPIVKFEIGRAKDNASYWETNGSDYYVYNLSNTAFIPKFLTPLKDKSNAGTTLVCRSNGFTCTVVSGEGTYTINATFKGNNLEGNWNKSYKGKVLQSATFTARKIVEM